MAGLWFIGRPGQLYGLSRAPARDYPRTADLQATVKQLLGGGLVVGRPVNAPRTYVYNWAWLDLAATDWTILAALGSRQLGPGPYTLIDGATANLLQPNQAATGTPLRSTDGWACVTPETLAVSSVTDPAAPLGDRSIAWTVPAAPASGVLRLTAPTPRTYLATPTEVTWAAWVRLTATAACTAHLTLSWRTSTGALLSTAVGPSAAVPTGGVFGRFAVEAIPPVGAWYLEPQVVLTPSSVTTSTTINVGSARLMLGEDDTTWYPGEGLPQVSVTGWAENVPYFLRRTAQLTLVEV